MKKAWGIRDRHPLDPEKAYRQPFGEQMISGRNSPHQYSPFQLEYLEARDYWLQFTEYLRAPAVGRFSGLPDLLLQVANLNGPAVSAAMQDQNQLSFQQSQAFWSRILGVFQDLGLPASEAKDAAPVWHFKTPWADSLCWSGVLSEARCCDPAFGTVGAPGCFDDFWTFHRCCVQNVSFPPLDDAACGSGGPYGTTLVSPLDGPPWVQEVPSQEEPFVFIWDVGRGFTVEFNPVLGIGMPEGTVKCEFQYEENSDADPRIGSVLWGRPAHKK
eukprot:s4410_g2.t1